MEFQKDALPEVIQKSADQKYDGYGKEAKHQLLKLSNHQCPVRTITTEGVIRKTADVPGNVHDVVFENIHVLAEEGITAPTIRLESVDERVHFEAPVIDGLYWNDEKQNDLSKFALTINNAEMAVVK